ncbi:MAG: hypothetical protein ACI8W7_000429 [Gammaproteobacteria bacterium]|jgi:hypothetical protein
MVDTFLSPADRAYTVPQVLRLASDNGLKFQDWMDRHYYSVSALIPGEMSIFHLASRLPPEERWHLVELLNQSLGMHCFLLCHPERDLNDIAIEFESSNADATWLTYIPHLRPPTEVICTSDQLLGTPATLQRAGKEFSISAHEVSIFEKIDGQTSIAQILAACSSTSTERQENLDIAFHLFSRMHEWDHILYEI